MAVDTAVRKRRPFQRWCGPGPGAGVAIEEDERFPVAGTAATEIAQAQRIEAHQVKEAHPAPNLPVEENVGQGASQQRSQPQPGHDAEMGASGHYPSSRSVSGSSIISIPSFSPPGLSGDQMSFVAAAKKLIASRA